MATKTLGMAIMPPALKQKGDFALRMSSRTQLSVISKERKHVQLEGELTGTPPYPISRSSPR